MANDTKAFSLYYISIVWASWVEYIWYINFYHRHPERILSSSCEHARMRKRNCLVWYYVWQRKQMLRAYSGIFSFSKFTLYHIIVFVCSEQATSTGAKETRPSREHRSGVAQKRGPLRRRRWARSEGIVFPYGKAWIGRKSVHDSY